MKRVDTKIVRIRYGLFDKPHHHKISAAISQWGGKGYSLVSQNEHKPGCLMRVLTLFWARGATELTFIREQQS